jgi:hypothetical protein
MVSIKKINNPESSDSTLGENKMANRIGKYKVSKRESALSLVDGGVIGGSITGAEGVVFGKSGVVTSGADYFSGAMTVPANSVITDLGVVVTTALAAGNGNWGFKFGDSADTADIAAEDPNGLATTATSVAVGIGTCMDAVHQTALGGAAVVVMDAGDAYRAAETDIHGTVTSAGGSITGGAVTFWVKYIQLG